MIIKTRFDVGQKVWFLVPPKTPRSIDGPYEVYQIATLVRAGYDKTGYFLSGHNSTQRRFEEDDLFESIQQAEQALDFHTQELDGDV